jgi:hypothetical protein
MRTHVQYSWNLGIQRQMTQKWFLSGTYVGTHIIHIWNAVELNPGQYFSGNCPAGIYGLTAPGPCSVAGNVNQRRILNLANPGSVPLGYLTQYDDGGTQGYNGLLLNTTWRTGQNLNVNANYTWSHCIGLPPITLLNPGANYVHQAYQNVGPANRNLDVGDCIQDRRQILNLTVVAQTPRFSNRMLRAIGSGWSFGTAYVARSGPPLTVLEGTDQALNGFQGNAGTERPNQVLGSAAAVNQGQGCANSPPCISWFNPAAFAQPAIGTYGNAGVGTMLGPMFWEWDEAVSRQFQIREGQKLEVRFEAFNVTNSFRPGTGGTNGAAGGGFVTRNNANNFGIIRTDATPPAPTTAPARVMQFALKYVF